MGFQVKIVGELAFNESSIRYFHCDAQSQGSNVFEEEQICDSISLEFAFLHLVAFCWHTLCSSTSPEGFGERTLLPS